MKHKLFTTLLVMLMSMTGSNAFAHDAEIDGIYYNFDGDEAIVTYKGEDKMPSDKNTYSGSVVIPSTVNYNAHTYTVTSIDNYAFYYCSTGLTSVVIPNSVTNIGYEAFGECWNLSSVEIPNSVTNIGFNAFESCGSLSSVNIPNCLTSLEDNVFHNCSGLRSIKIPNSVTSIGQYAFGGCTGLRSIEIPNSVTSIGADAFEDTPWYNSKPNGLVYIGKIAYKYKGTMPSGSSIVLAEGTTEISATAFRNCSGLISIDIPSSVTSIGWGAFDGCSGLTSIEIPNSVTSIGSSAFYGCTNLTSIDIPNSVTNVGFSAFKDTPWYNNKPDGLLYIGKVAYVYKGTMPSSTSIVLEEGTTSICACAFNKCTGLTSIEIPNSVTSIGSSAFADCSGLSSIEIPTSVTSIGAYAFNNCTGLTSIEMNSVTSIGYCAFGSCSSLTSLEMNSVTSIDEGAFSGCAGLTSLVIPRSVTSIGNYAFRGCTGLTSIMVESGNTKYVSRNNCNAIIKKYSNILIIGCQNTIIPNDLTGIADYAFYNCSGLASVVIPSGVTSIGSSAFSGCTDLTSVEIPNSVRSIGESAFKGCTGLTSIEMNGVTSIDKYAFNGCSGLTSIEMNGVTSIGYGAFLNCTGLTTIKMNSVTRIEESAFVNCNNLNSITIPSSLTRLGKFVLELKNISNDVFNGCSCLTSITVESENTKYDSRNNCNAIIETGSNTLIVGCKNTVIPNTVTSIAGSAFSGCIGLTSIEIPNSVRIIRKSAFNGCTSLTSIEIPNSVTSISDGAFSGCTGLTSIKIPNSVTSIGWGSFSGCTSLTSIEIPSSVTSVGNNVFKGCSGLTIVRVDWKKPISIYNDVFSNRTNATLYVPKGCKAAYQAANYWKEFKEILESEEDDKAIVFADSNAKALCVKNWDTDNDGELSLFEAENVTSLGDVFSNSAVTSFNELQYFTGLQSLQKNAFAGCKSLTEIKIPSSVTSIGSGAFANCSSLTSIIVESGNTVYDSRNNCNAIIRTSNNVLVVGCKNTVIPSSVTTIGGSAFYGCTGLTSIGIPNSVTSISGSAFYGCTGLTSIGIPNSVTSINGSAFYGCTGLTSIEIPSKVNEIDSEAFKGCSGLTSITVASGNTKYDSRDNCNAIIKKSNSSLIAGCQNTVIPNSVKIIDWYSFYGCTGLTSIVIPNSVTSIYGCAFENCTSLTSIEIPNSVTSISGSVFSGCTSLTSIEIPSSVTYVGYNAFLETPWYNNKPDGVVYVSKMVYNYKGTMPSGTNIVLEEGTTSICAYAFNKCIGLTSIEIPNSVTSIDFSSFFGCSDLTIVKVEWDTPISISKHVFSNRTNATLYVPKGSKAAYEAADYWKEFKEIKEIDDNIAFADSNVKALCVENWDTDNDGELSMPEAAAVTSLGDVFSNSTIVSFNELQYFTGLQGLDENAFAGCKSLTEIKVPSGVTSIGKDAFKGCAALTSIEIPSSVTSITGGAFASCSGLASIIVEAGNTVYDSRDNCNAIIQTSSNALVAGCKNTIIPSSVTSIAGSAFYGCTGLTSIELPSKVKTIGGSAFYGCTGLTSIEIPSKATSIGNYAFKSCSGLTTITVASGNTKYDSRDNCNAIIKKSSNALIAGCQNTVIPNSVTSIAGSAFYYCTGLTTIEIPSSVTSIGGSAFYGCSSLTSIEIPSGVTSVGSSTFRGCTSLTSVVIPTGVTSIGGSAFRSCTSLTSVVIPNGVTTIGGYAFCGCTGLASVEIPNSVTSIVGSAFRGCTGLTSIELPSSVASIGDHAFYGCKYLTSVKVEWDAPVSISSSVFSSRTKATLYVPAGSKAAYEAADYWKNFKKIVEYARTALIKMGVNGIMTYSNSSGLDFTNVPELKAYMAFGYNPTTGDLILSRVYKVPAGEGLLLKAEAGSYKVTCEDVNYIYSNMLVGVPTATVVYPTEGDYTNFILAKDAVNGIGFYPLASAGEIGANKAYFQLPTSALPSASRSIRMVFDDEEDVTGINSMKADVESKSVFDLQGRRVSNPTHGLYIKDGKKFIKK